MLEELFIRDFKFDSNCGIEITFQRRQDDPDWGEMFIDLDEDSVLYHKDRLKAVVTPVLTTPKHSSEVGDLLYIKINIIASYNYLGHAGVF